MFGNENAVHISSVVYNNLLTRSITRGVGKVLFVINVFLQDVP
jgi:hypothetical protein